MNEDPKPADKLPAGEPIAQAAQARWLLFPATATADEILAAVLGTDAEPPAPR
jgi:hypothetical protein